MAESSGKKQGVIYFKMKRAFVGLASTASGIYIYEKKTKQKKQGDEGRGAGFEALSTAQSSWRTCENNAVGGDYAHRRSGIIRRLDCVLYLHEAAWQEREKVNDGEAGAAVRRVFN